MTYGSISELIADTLAPGERRLSFAAVHRLAGQDEAEEVAIVLTDQRLLVASVAWPSDYELTEALDRAVCSVLRQKDREDGSSLLAVGHPEGVLALEFPPTWRKEAYAIREALAPRAGTAALMDTSSEENLRGALGDVWKDRLLTVPTSSPEADNARLMYDAVQGPPRHAGLEDEVFAQLRELAVEVEQAEEEF